MSDTPLPGLRALFKRELSQAILDEDKASARVAHWTNALAQLTEIERLSNIVWDCESRRYVSKTESD